MNTGEFDSLLRDQFDDGEFAYKPAQWDHMVIALNNAGNVQKKKKRILPVLGMAAALAVALISSGLWLLRKPAAEVARIVPSTQQIKTQASSFTTDEKNPGQTDNGASGDNTVVTGINNKCATQRLAQSATSGQMAQQMQVNASADTGTTVVAANTASEKQSTEKPQKKYDKLDLSMPLDDYPDEIKRSKKFSVGVTGGVNYGSSSSGYMAGVNARQPLGRKFYIDGDLAVISSKNLQNTANYSSADYTALSNYAGTDHSGVNGPGTSLGNTTAPPKGQAVTNLYYLQFAPTLGYQLIKKVSVGVGADFQRKLQHDDVTTVVSDNPQADDIKLVPNMDIGLTGKAEYAITKKLKAGVLYRGGVNSWVDPKYVNRNYMQVQMKLMIFGK